MRRQPTAGAAGILVVLIGRFTRPTNEFETPYRVINHHACISYWSDVRVRFGHKDFLWCPRHEDTQRQFEMHAARCQPRQGGD